MASSDGPRHERAQDRLQMHSQHACKLLNDVAGNRQIFLDYVAYGGEHSVAIGNNCDAQLYDLLISCLKPCLLIL